MVEMQNRRGNHYSTKQEMGNQDRHDYLLRILNLAGGSTGIRQTHDVDVIKEHHKFLWGDEESLTNLSWEMRLARRYYDKLFKEYCVADLTRHKENKVALRWRTEDEVISGKGQFQCGSRKCEEKEILRSWEVNFAYKEQGVLKNSLVKLRLCPFHSDQLNYTSRKREVKRLRKSVQKHVKNKKSNMADGAENSLKSNSLLPEESIARSTCPEETVCVSGDNIWGRKSDTDVENTSRETEFERYLEDLLL